MEPKQVPPSGVETIKETEAFHRAVRILTSTLCVWDSGHWIAMSEKEARIAAAALDRSHMLVVPPDVTTRNMGLRKAEEHPDAEEA